MGRRMVLGAVHQCSGRLIGRRDNGYFLAGQESRNVLRYTFFASGLLS